MFFSIFWQTWDFLLLLQLHAVILPAALIQTPSDGRAPTLSRYLHHWTCQMDPGSCGGNQRTAPDPAGGGQMLKSTVWRLTEVFRASVVPVGWLWVCPWGHVSQFWRYLYHQLGYCLQPLQLSWRGSWSDWIFLLLCVQQYQSEANRDRKKLHGFLKTTIHTVHIRYVQYVPEIWLDVWERSIVENSILCSFKSL